MATGMKQVAFITGAAGGIGAATMHRFLVGGWSVVGVDLASVAVPPDSTQDVLEVTADLRSVEACRAAVEQGAAWKGRLDAVVNAAGVWTEGPAAATTEQQWDQVIDLNLKGLYFVSVSAIPHLRATSGCIINLSSDAGVQGNAGAAVYCASKGGVCVLTKALALELAQQGVRVNAVCPGDVDSPMLHGQAEQFGTGDPPAYLGRLLAAYPQGAAARFVRTDEVAELIWFLAQPHAAAITGANISIDFGLSAGIA